MAIGVDDIRGVIRNHDIRRGDRTDERTQERSDENGKGAGTN